MGTVVASQIRLQRILAMIINLYELVHVQRGVIRHAYMCNSSLNSWHLL
jgi:hypothetical protein